METSELARRLINQRSWVSQPAVSPDGARVACVVATTDLEENKTTTKVWLDGRPISGESHDGNPSWSPDGTQLAFTSRRGEKKGDSTLHVLSIDGPGETLQLCTMPEAVTDVSWSPDGSTIGFLSRTRDERYDITEVSRQPPRKIERFFSRLNAEDWVYDRPKQVYVVAADGTGTPRNLTPGEYEHSGLSWTSDSSAIVTAAARHDTWDQDLTQDLYFVPLAATDDASLIRCLTSRDGTYQLPSVSPDGTRVAFIGWGEPMTFPQNAAVGVLDLSVTGATFDDICWSSNGLDRTFFPTVGVRAPVWQDNETLLATAEDRGDTHLYAMPADGSAAPQALTEGPSTVQAFDCRGNTTATAVTTATCPAELVVNGSPATTVTRTFARDLLPWDKHLAPSLDGTVDIDYWVMRPRDFDPAKTYPVLLNVHGGPFTQYGEYFMDEFQMQAAAGFVVVAGNPRGGSGRDTAWGQSILGPKHPLRPGTGWGSCDVDDVLAIIDHALDQFSFCDATRVGMLGGSYGGFMATWLAANHGERFKAFCSERAVNNLLSEEWSSDIATAFRTEHGPSHIEDPEVYRSRSPIESVRNIDKPMLIIHSEEDWRCPIVQAEELWVALKLLGREVDFYRFPGENHELSRSGSPVHRVQRAEIILDWFAEKLG